MVLKRFVSAVFTLMVITGMVFSGGKSQTAPAGAAKSTLNFTGYPMKAGDQSVSLYFGWAWGLNSAYATTKESPFHTGLDEMLGTHIAWQHPTAGTPESTAFNLMMAGEKLPDIIYFTFMNDAERYIDEGAIYDLTPYIKEWAPNYYKWLQTNPAYDRTFKTDSGKYYGFGCFREAGGWNDSYMGPVIRKDWLDANGLPIPQTIADWDKTLRVFKQKYGATLSFARNRFQSTGISGAFDAYTALDFKLYVDKNGKVRAANSDPGYRNYLAKLNEWWREGLLDQNFMTVDDTIARTNALNGKVGLSYTAISQIGNWESDAQKANNGAKWVGIQHPHGNDGTLSMVFGGYGINSAVGAITTSCPPEKLELAMRVLDYGYSEEGIKYWNYGKKGVSWDYDAKGEVVFTPLLTNDPNGLVDAVSKYVGVSGNGPSIQTTRFLYLRMPPIAIEANNTFFYPNQDVTAYWTLPNGMTLTPDESARAAELRNPIATYASEMAVKFITGQENISGYDSFVARMNTMGLPELIRIYQAAYDRFLRR